ELRQTRPLVAASDRTGKHRASSVGLPRRASIGALLPARGSRRPATPREWPQWPLSATCVAAFGHGPARARLHKSASRRFVEPPRSGRAIAVRHRRDATGPIFFASDGAEVIDPDGSDVLFETPIMGPLPEDLVFFP